MEGRDEYGRIVEQRAVGLAVGNERLNISKAMSWLLAAWLGLVGHWADGWIWADCKTTCGGGLAIDYGSETIGYWLSGRWAVNSLPILLAVGNLTVKAHQ